MPLLFRCTIESANSPGPPLEQASPMRSHRGGCLGLPLVTFCPFWPRFTTLRKQQGGGLSRCEFQCTMMFMVCFFAPKEQISAGSHASKGVPEQRGGGWTSFGSRVVYRNRDKEGMRACVCVVSVWRACLGLQATHLLVVINPLGPPSVNWWMFRKKWGRGNPLCFFPLP